MTMYNWYILALAAFTLPIAYWLARKNERRRTLLLAARIASLMTVLLYPWDYFGIRHGAWTHPSFTGWRIYGVPLNDLAFIWLFTYLACVVLIRFDRGKSHGYTHPQSQRTNDQDPIHQRG